MSTSGLTELPQAVAHLPRLATLLVAGNELTTVPAGPYPALEKLDLRNNGFR